MGNMESAESIFSKVMQRSLLSFNAIFTFRQTAQISLSYAEPRLSMVERHYAENILKTPYGNRFFTDKNKFLKLVGGFEAYVESSAKNRASQFTNMVEAASLIYAHSILDAITYDLFVVSSLLSPSSWRTYVERKKVVFSDVLSKSAQQIEREMVSSCVASLERESLLKKIEILHSICKPPKMFSPIHEYTFDPERLKRLDDLRHEIVHGLNPLSKSIQISEIEFFQKTSLYLAVMVSDAFGIKVDPKKIFWPQV